MPKPKTFAEIVDLVAQAVNGGLIGIDDRIELFEHYSKILS